MSELSNLAGQLVKAAVRTLKNPLAEAVHEEFEPKIQAALDEQFTGPALDRLQSGVEVTRRVIQRTRKKLEQRVTE